MSARCGEKYTGENITLARYKNSHLYGHSALSYQKQEFVQVERLILFTVNTMGR